MRLPFYHDYDEVRVTRHILATLAIFISTIVAVLVGILTAWILS